MGICVSKPPPKPNPYAGRRDAPEYPEPPQTPARRPPPELDKNFGLSNKFASNFELVGEKVGRGHFGYSCSAIAKKGHEMKGQKVAVKIIPKLMTTTIIAIEDVGREVKILRALAGHPNITQFYGAFEDDDNVYIVMELCEEGEFLDRIILTRGEKYSEDYAKEVIVQILNVVAFCHLRGVVHLDVKPESFLFISKDEHSQLKAINFVSSDFIRPDQKLNEIVGSSYYTAPEALNKSCSTEADVWSAISNTNPNFDENPWPLLSSESKDFVRHLLDKDPSRRITAAQALCHPWLRNHDKVILKLDVLIFRLMKGYMRSSSLRKAALRALAKTLTVNETFYLREQFNLMCPDASGGITLETIKMALMKNATDVSTESRFLSLLDPLNALQYRKMYFEEFCAAALDVCQLETLDCWENRTRSAYEIFERNGNRAIVIEELASELELSPSVPVHAALQEWVRPSDGKLTFLGFLKLLNGQCDG